MKPATIIDKIWDLHVIRDLGDGWALLHIDRHLLHDLAGGAVIGAVTERGIGVRNPELTFATPDHAVPTNPHRNTDTYPVGERLRQELKTAAVAGRFRMFDLDEPGQGIVHVMASEMGITLPGSTLICCDSHTCTNGGLGALAFGVGTSEGIHAAATQTLRVRKPLRMRVSVEGRLGPGITAKDVILHCIRLLGTAGATGHAVEFAGSAIRAMSVEARLTLCNVAAELGARSAVVAPDDAVFEYLRDRPFAPRGGMLERAVAHWRTLATDDGATFDREVMIDASDIAPSVSWGTSPEQTISIAEAIPGPEAAGTGGQHASIQAALDYMGLRPDGPIDGVAVD